MALQILDPADSMPDQNSPGSSPNFAPSDANVATGQQRLKDIGHFASGVARGSIANTASIPQQLHDFLLKHPGIQSPFSHSGSLVGEQSSDNSPLPSQADILKALPSTGGSNEELLGDDLGSIIPTPGAGSGIKALGRLPRMMADGGAMLPSSAQPLDPAQGPQLPVQQPSAPEQVDPQVAKLDVPAKNLLKGYEDGHHWVELSHPDQLAAENDYMSHAMGSTAGENSHYMSLRGPDGLSKATLEVAPNGQALNHENFKNNLHSLAATDPSAYFPHPGDAQAYQQLAGNDPQHPLPYTEQEFNQAMSPDSPSFRQMQRSYLDSKGAVWKVQGVKGRFNAPISQDSQPKVQDMLLHSANAAHISKWDPEASNQHALAKHGLMLPPVSTAS